MEIEPGGDREDASRIPNTQHPTPKTCAILLAAGASRRMGAPKPLLLWRGEPLVRKTARILLEGGAESVVVVVGPGEGGEAVARAVADMAGVRVAKNNEPERGMLSSIQAGIRAACRETETVRAVLVCPCDFPRLKAGHIAAVLDGWDGDPQAIVVPTFGGKRGHPGLFGGGLFTDILNRDPTAVGLNTLLAERADALTTVSVESDAILRDADTPDEWRQLEEEGSQE